ncbi:MAG: dTMP kinase [Candidatus Methanofastidiosia archaeon]
MVFPQNINKGKFIVIEGIDGSGLSTQTAILKERLTSEGIKTYQTKEPTDGPVGGVLRLALTKRISITPETFALLFAADRMDHLTKEIVPKLEEGIAVICDRYYFSNFAYQGIDLDMDWLIRLNCKALLPDATIFLDVDPLECEKRRESRMRVEHFEEIEKLRKIREKYLEVLKKFGDETKAKIEIVNANNSIEQVADDILSAISPVIKGI